MTAEGSVRVDNQNQASGDAQVGQQIGVQFQESVLIGTMIYQCSWDDPPEWKHEVAARLLEGGSPRKAEVVFRDLVNGGHITTERAYFYVLSILSERSFIEITAALTDEIHNVQKLCSSLPADRWTAALEVVLALLGHAHATFDGDTVQQELSSYRALDGERQLEIDRHLDLILSGAAQERISAQRKRTVADERMARGRLDRAWKFFEADPRPPSTYRLVPFRSNALAWRYVLLGFAVTALALPSVVGGGVSAPAGLGLALWVAGAWVVFHCTLILETHFLDAAVTKDEFAVLYEEDVEEPTKKPVNLVDHRFRLHSKAVDWLDYTAGYREHLKRRLRAQYTDKNMRHGEVTWLVDWHVERIDAKFVLGESYDRVLPPAGLRSAFVLRALGVLLGAVGLFLLLRDGHLQALFLAAAYLGVVGAARLRSRPRVQMLLDGRADALYEEELAAFENWRQTLADRPSDAEIARWLALDKLHLKHEALRQTDLNERDLVTHVVLTERVDFARRSRVTNGPPRYERYNVQIFLLTRYGMRSVRSLLEFKNGGIRHGKREMFPYDAVASASIDEKDGPGSRVFELTLVNGTKIAEVKENRRNAVDVEQDSAEDPDLPASRDAGFDSALRVLEAVASEGRDWIVRDEERKRRWASNWSP
ncbi:hypothetical protein BBK82_08565 [Lentzea guizhouensis]|uniref:Uncharacterized protein n=1 Tax=Lentzea guizhouensis TaxID=1586287 RepID=A0A1B2HEH6_9PSEU|nr:hypothetical protein [Lentzea guizhouensis]ANZ36111.1 hypothetical protein BBK82_08565 [Lentzea guizhouensis]